MIDMPAAGGFSDGEISFTSSYNKSNLRNTLSFQALPRVFGAFRYAGIGDQERLYYSSSGYTTWDRSFDFRIDLLKESTLLPDFTVGFQDVFGTGIYSSEYLVASKSILPNFRSTVGVGWGRLGTKNIISKLGSKTKLVETLEDF